ncbi:MAG: hypothetical protein BPHS0_09 [Phage 5P_3]|nr:MAG: hypothetical protein BPHS0_09 [Phage 5P_3]
MKINRVWLLALTVAVLACAYGVGYLFTRPVSHMGALGASYPGHEGQGVFFADGNTLVIADEGTLEMQPGSTVTGVDVGCTGTITSSTGVFTTSLTLEGVALSGPLTFGREQTVTCGTLIAHGLATTPTMVSLTSHGAVTGTLGILAANATSFTVSCDPALTFDYVYWIAGK